MLDSLKKLMEDAENGNPYKVNCHDGVLGKLMNDAENGKPYRVNNIREDWIYYYIYEANGKVHYRGKK